MGEGTRGAGRVCVVSGVRAAQAHASRQSGRARQILVVWTERACLGLSDCIGVPECCGRGARLARAGAAGAAQRAASRR